MKPTLKLVKEIIRPDQSEDTLRATGKKVHEALNFSLFNARPHRKRVTWCFYELRDLGYQPANLEEPFIQIPAFFEKRTLDHQAELARRMFGLEWSDELARALVLRYQHIEISEEQIEAIASTVQSHLEEVADLQGVGIDFELLKAAIRMNYTLQHYEDLDEFSLARLFDCIREQAERAGLEREVLMLTDQLLNAIDPAKKKVLTPAEIDWLLETVMLSTEAELQLYRTEIKGMNEHPPELEKVLRATESFNALLKKSLSGETPLSNKAANQLRELIRRSADALLQANLQGQ